MTIQESVDELRVEIERLELDIAAPLVTICNHLVCPACEIAISDEKKEKEKMQIKLDEKKSLYEKIKAYGSDEQS